MSKARQGKGIKEERKIISAKDGRISVIAGKVLKQKIEIYSSVNRLTESECIRIALCVFFNLHGSESLNSLDLSMLQQDRIKQGKPRQY